jgi:hypothetical protein
VSRRHETVLQFWVDRAKGAAASPDPPLPAKKKFKPKFDLPPIANYNAAADHQFWQTFPSNRIKLGTSPVSAVRLRAWANAVGCSDRDRLNTVCRDIENGADIGCRGEYRNPTTSSNAPSAIQHGAEVTDAVADWINQGIVAGPLDPSLRPTNAKVNGMMCRLKPNGTARIILNMSAPKGKCVNEGIDNNLFPATMASTSKWLEVLDKAGKHCQIMKVDWASAYKHIAVRAEDLPLQYFSWLGKDFIELMLIFGAVSSAGLYDRLAKVVLDLVIRYAKFPLDMVIQYLDDVCAAAPHGCQSLSVFQEAYRTLAADIGVQLAPYTDPDKAFSCTTTGVVLGIQYDTVSWTWSIPTEKLSRVLHQLRTGLDSDSMIQHEMWSLVGRLTHYAPLIPCGKFNIGNLIIASASSTDRNNTIILDQNIKRQLYFWWLMLKVTDRVTAIPPPAMTFPAWTLEYYTDASGGSSQSLGHGTGGIGGKFWFLVPWGKKINSGIKDTDGKRLSRKLSALELVGPLICVSADQATCANRPVRIWFDNSGSVAVWRKGYSTRCQLCTTLVNAISRITAANGCRITIDKVRRCSNDGSILADELSKGRFAAFKRKLPDSWEISPQPAWIPPSILAWIANPVEDHSLGDRILDDMRKHAVDHANSV